jgi:hypothetical protein
MPSSNRASRERIDFRISNCSIVIRDDSNEPVLKVFENMKELED